MEIKQLVSQNPKMTNEIRDSSCTHSTRHKIANCLKVRQLDNYKSGKSDAKLKKQA